MALLVRPSTSQVDALKKPADPGKKEGPVSALGPGYTDCDCVARLAEKITIFNYCTIFSIKFGDWRIDGQPGSATYANIQIQRNNVKPPSTVACVIVPKQDAEQVSAAGPNSDQARLMSAELSKAIGDGLRRSQSTRRLNEGSKMPSFKLLKYEISGDLSKYEKSP